MVSCRLVDLPVHLFTMIIQTDVLNEYLADAFR